MNNTYYDNMYQLSIHFWSIFPIVFFYGDNRKKIGPESPILVIGLQGYQPRLSLKRLKRNFHRLQLLVLLDLRSSPTVLSISLLFTLSRPDQPHQKHTSSCNTILFTRCGTVCKYVSGGAGRNRTAVQNTFHSTSYNNTFIYSSLPPLSPYNQYKYIPTNSTTNKEPTINQSTTISLI